jgi:hypothetical protein
MDQRRETTKFEHTSSASRVWLASHLSSQKGMDRMRAVRTLSSAARRMKPDRPCRYVSLFEAASFVGEKIPAPPRIEN